MEKVTTERGEKRECTIGSPVRNSMDSSLLLQTIKSECLHVIENNSVLIWFLWDYFGPA